MIKDKQIGLIILLFVGVCLIAQNSSASENDTKLCHQLAADPDYPTQNKLPEVSLHKIDSKQALKFCKAAVRLNPKNQRLQFQLFRAKASQYLNDNQPTDFISLLKESYKNGDQNAGLVLAEIYLTKRFRGEYLHRAFDIYLDIANRKSNISKAKLTRKLLQNQIPEKYLPRVISFFENEINQGDHFAPLFLGLFFEKHNINRSVYWFEKSYEQGIISGGARALARLYSRNPEIKDEIKARLWLERSILRGNVTALDEIDFQISVDKFSENEKLKSLDIIEKFLSHTQSRTQKSFIDRKFIANYQWLIKELNTSLGKKL